MDTFPLPKMKSCGTYFKDETEVIPEIRTVKEFEIEYFTSDGAPFFLDGKKYYTKKGHVLLAKPGQERLNYHPFSTVYFKLKATSTTKDRLLNTPDYFQPAYPEDVLQEMKDIILIEQEGKNPLLFYGKLLKFIDKLIKESHSNPDRREAHDDAVARAKEYMKNNFQKPIRLKDIASVTHMSETYFHKIFTSVYGKSPNDYLTDYRINQAKNLLGFTRFSVGEISEKCGFCSQQYFNKIFKNHLGMSPTDYRKNMMENYE